jgi:hypothetical protein
MPFVSVQSCIPVDPLLFVGEVRMEPMQNCGFLRWPPPPLLEAVHRGAPKRPPWEMLHGVKFAFGESAFKEVKLLINVLQYMLEYQCILYIDNYIDIYIYKYASPKKT